MKTKRQKKGAEKNAISGNHELLIQKFKCRPCFVRLALPSKRIKFPKFTEKPNTAGRITRRRATVDSHSVAEKLAPNPPSIRQRRGSTSERSTASERISRSVRFSVLVNEKISLLSIDSRNKDWSVFIKN